MLTSLYEQNEMWSYRQALSNEFAKIGVDKDENGPCSIWIDLEKRVSIHMYLPNETNSLRDGFNVLANEGTRQCDTPIDQLEAVESTRR